MAGRLLAGVITYDPTARIIALQSFPEDAPATLDHVLAADRQNQWNVVTYDQTTDIWRVNASLYIGSANDLGTFMQIGRAGHPCETVIVKGDVWIKAPKTSGLRPDGHLAIANRLTLGCATNPAIAATLKIDCFRAGEYALVLGSRTGGQWSAGSDLHVYNSTITALTPDKDHMFAGSKEFDGDKPAWYGTDIRLINSTISWMHNWYAPCYQMVLEGTTLENINGSWRHGGQIARNCIFRNWSSAAAVNGCFTKCVFTNNDCNWAMDGQSGGITMIDCRVGPQKTPIRIRKNNITPEEAIKARSPVYPIYCEIAPLVIRVADRRGRPISNAWVNVSYAEDSTAVQNGLAITDGQGLTPADPEQDAILITRKKLLATDTPNQPQSFAFNYAVTVQARGYRNAKAVLRHDQELPRPLGIALDAFP